MHRLFEIIHELLPTLKISDEEILKTYYSVRKILESKIVSEEDPFYLIDAEIIAGTNGARQLAAIPIMELIKGMPLYIANYSAFKKSLEDINLSDDYETVVTIAITANSVRLDYTSKDIKANYRQYCDIAKKTDAHALSFNNYLHLNNTVHYYEYDGLYTLKNIGAKIDSYKEDRLLNKLSDLANKTYMSRENRLRFVSDSLRGDSIHTLLSDHLEGDFSKLDESELGWSLSEVQKEICRATPLDCFKRLFIMKMSHYYRLDMDEGVPTKQLTDKAFLKTNASIEIGLLYRLMQMDIPTMRKGAIAALDPSPFFTQELVENNRKLDVIIANKNPDESDMLEMHYKDSASRSRYSERLTVNSMDEFADAELDDCSVAAIIENSFSAAEIKQETRHLCNASNGYIWVLCSDEVAKEILCESSCNADVFILPVNLYNNPDPKRKSIVRLFPDPGERVILYSLTVSEAIEDGIQLVGVNSKAQIERQDLTRNDVTIRKATNISEKGVVRQKRKMFPFSPEITFVASVPNANKEGIIMGKAYYRHNGKTVNETKASYRLKPIEIDDWVTKDYPYRTIGKRDGANVEIREVVGSYLRADYAGIPVSLRTLAYMYRDMDDYISTLQKSICKELLSSEIGAMNPAYDAMEDFEEMIEQVFKDKPDVWKSKANDIIALLTDFACEKGHMSSERTDRFFESIYDYKAGRSNISRVLSKRSLNSTRLKQIAKKILEIEPLQLRILLLIRLTTGIEADALCALNQEDFITSRDGDRSFVISKLCSFDGSRLIPVRRMQQSRLVPCTKMISQLIEDFCVIEGDPKAPLFKTDNGRVSPQMISQETNRILAEMELGSVDAYIYDARRITRRVDLSEARKDLFRGNFSYWARQQDALFEDEIRFVLGVRRETTDGIHYIDFEAETSQERLRRNLQAVEAFMLKGMV